MKNGSQPMVTGNRARAGCFHEGEENRKPMEFELLTSESPEWEAVIAFAQTCSWSAGQSLANAMRRNRFEDWERVVVAMEQGRVAGFCTVTKADCIPELPYTPYIGYVFVGEAHRGSRLSERMLQLAAEYLKRVGFERVYLISDHVNLYEKYGFQVVDEQVAPWGEMEKIYMRRL